MDTSERWPGSELNRREHVGCAKGGARVVEPRIVRLDVSHLEPVDQALLGNSITLTPGTLTLDVDQGQLLVHALDVDGAQALIDGEMQRRVEDLRGN